MMQRALLTIHGHTVDRLAALLTLLAVIAALLGSLVLVLWISHNSEQITRNANSIDALTQSRHVRLVILARADIAVCRAVNELSAVEHKKWERLSVIVNAGVPDKPGDPGYDYYVEHPEQLQIVKERTAQLVAEMLVQHHKNCATLPSLEVLPSADKHRLLHES